MHIYNKQNIVLGVGGTALLFLILFSIFSNNEQSNVAERITEKYFLSNATSVPVRVSGVLESKDKMTVYAQVSGDVIKLPKEGDILTKNAHVAQIDTPVVRAQYTQAQAQSKLTQTQQNLVFDQTETQYVNQSLTKNATDQIASLRKESNRENLKDAKESLITNIERSILQIVTVFDYIDTNRRLFTAAGIEQYESILRDVYSRTPTFFGNGLLHGGNEAQLELQERFESMTTSEQDSADELLLLAQDTRLVLTKLSEVLETGEHKVFDERTITVNSDEYDAFIDVRDTVLSSRVNLETYSARLQNAADAIEEDSVLQSRNTNLASVETSFAENAVQLQKEISNDTNRLTQANTQVLASQLELTEIYTPFDAVVTKVFVENGEYVKAGTPLFELKGTDIYEIEVSVPARFASYVSLGQPFSIDGDVVGHVDRYAPVLQHGSLQVFVVVSGEMYMDGEVLTGELSVSSEDVEVYVVPRSYVHYDTTGPLLRYRDESTTSVVIVYDAGERLYVVPNDAKKQALAPSVGGKL